MSIDAGSPPGHASSGPPRPTVVLACSGPEAGAIVSVARALIADGVRVDVVAGVDLDSRPIELALEQHFGNTLWVMCRSDQLDEYQLELLLLTVRASEVLEEHVIALPYDADATDTFVASIRRRLLSLSWIASEPGIPAPRPNHVTPVPSLAPEASGFGEVAAPTGRRVLGAALAVLACLGVGAWWAGGSAAEAKETRVAVARSEAAVATSRGHAPKAARAESPAAHREAASPRPAPARAPVPAERPEPAKASTGVEPPRPATLQLSGPVGKALAERKIRALDALLVSAPGASATARRAVKQCGKLKIAGVNAWRLPLPEELGELAQAGFLPDEARYWTRRGKASRRAVVERERVHTRKAGRKARANVLCVAVAKA